MNPGVSSSTGHHFPWIDHIGKGEVKLLWKVLPSLAWFIFLETIRTFHNHLFSPPQSGRISHHEIMPIFLHFSHPSSCSVVLGGGGHTDYYFSSCLNSWSFDSSLSCPIRSRDHLWSDTLMMIIRIWSSFLFYKKRITRITTNNRPLRPLSVM